MKIVVEFQYLLAPIAFTMSPTQSGPCAGAPGWSELLNAGTGERASTSEDSMTDIARLFQAFLAPAIFVSATGLLILSINVRLMGFVSRLRQYVHAKHDAA